MTKLPQFIRNFFKKEDIFCIRPFKSLTIMPNGNIQVCCSSGNILFQDGLPLSVDGMRIEDIWNCQSILQMRKNSAQGKRTIGCSGCYALEEKGLASRRVNLSNAWVSGFINSKDETIEEVVKKAKQNRYHLDDYPTDIQLIFGNKCNCKCRICGSNFSSSIEKDPVHSMWRPPIKGNTEWHKESNIAYQLIDRPEPIERLNIVGGEPLLIKEVGDILELMINNSHHKHTVIILTTNATHINHATLKKLSLFKNLQISLSIDAIGDLLTYIRYPANWNAVRKNIRIIQSINPQTLLIAPTLCAYNLLSITDLAMFCDSNELDLYINILPQPAYLRIDILPENILKESMSRIKSYLEKSDVRQKNRVELMKVNNYLSSVNQEHPADDLTEFMLFTNDLDLSRNQNIHNSVPELITMLDQAGTDWIEDTRFA